jgi:translocation and assembly module TamB
MASPVTIPFTSGTPVPKKKRPWLRWTLLVLFVLLLVGGWLAPGVLAKSAYKDQFVADLTADVHGTVTVGEVSLNWLHPVEAFDVKVVDATGREVVTAKRVCTSKSLLELLMNRAELGTIRVEEPRAEITFENGTTNVQQAFAKYIDGPSRETRPAVAVEVSDGTVRLTDVARKQTTELTAVGGAVAIPTASEPITFHLSATAGGPVTAEGQIGGENKLTLDATGFDVAALAPAVRHVAPDISAGGKLTSKLTATWATKEKGLPTFAVEGTVSVSDVSVTAPQLGDKPVKLASADMPLSVSCDGRTLKVAKFSLTCDVGTVAFAGEYDTAAPLQAMLNQPGLKFDADLDLAKLGNTAPGLLRLKPGTELTRGRVVAKLASAAGPNGVTWSGSVVTSKIEGVSSGRAVSWEQPLSVAFAGRVRPDGLPEFDDLVVSSDFIGARAQGGPESFRAKANVNLDVLSKHLEDLLDLNGLKLQGYAKEFEVKVQPNPRGGFTLTAEGAVLNLAVRDNSGVLVSDPNLKLFATADGDIKNGVVRIDSGRANVTAGTDTLGVVLLDPVSDLTKFDSGKASVALTGDLNKWRGRVGKLVGWPSDWAIGGTATEATGVVTLGRVISAEKVKVAVTNAHYRGCGLAIDEPTLRVDTVEPDGRIVFDPKAGTVAFTRAAVASETISGAVAKLDVTPNTKGEYGMSGNANVVARLDRVQKTLQLQSARDLSDQFRGTATGAVSVVAPTFDTMTFTVDLAIDKFAFGPPQSPTWAEPWVKVKGGVGYKFFTDTLTLTNAVVERDGLTVSGTGTIARMSTEANLNVSGTLGYDLARVEPLLKQYLGKTAAASGKDVKAFKASGPVLGGKPVTVDVSGLSGTAGLGWTSLKAYGFEVGKGELTATADRGRVTSTPVRATFGGGTVTAEPTLRLTPGANDLSLKPGRVVEKAKLTPEVCAEALGYALPAIANSAQADGVVSFDLAENTFPLTDPAAGSFKGTLTIHEGAVSPGPVVTQILEVLDITSPSVQLAKESAVPVEMKGGRVTHSNFTFMVGNTPVTTSGSVGTDGTLDLTVSVPVGGTIAEKIAPNQPAIQKAIAKQQISVKVKGTLAKPQLDSEGMRGQLQAVLKGTAKEAVQDKGQELIDDALKKGLDKLFKKK